MIESFLATQKNSNFVDVFSEMLTKDGKMMPELFIEDMLHLNEKGYSLWKKTLKPYVLKP